MYLPHHSIPRVVHGDGCIASVGSEVQRLGGKRTIIVTDRGITRIGLHDRLCLSLRDADIVYHVYDGVELEPDSDSMTKCLEHIHEFKAEVVIGFGGGSALDSAKAAAVLATNDGPIEMYFGIDMVRTPPLPMIHIPTTAGTGSEMTPIAVITDKKSGTKQSLVSDMLYARCVILDPRLTIGLPPHVTAMTGIDAFVHAMESYVGNKASVFTDALNLQAMKMISANIREAYWNGGNINARSQMLYGSALAGMAFGNTQNGIVHAIANSVPSKLKLPHGLLVAAMAPIGMTYNYMANPEKFSCIRDILRGIHPTKEPDMEQARDSINAFRSLLHDLNISPNMMDYGIRYSDLKGIAMRASNARRLMDNNPRHGCSDDIHELLESAAAAI